MNKDSKVIFIIVGICLIRLLKNKKKLIIYIKFLKETFQLRFLMCYIHNLFFKNINKYTSYKKIFFVLKCHIFLIFDDFFH